MNLVHCDRVLKKSYEQKGTTTVALTCHIDHSYKVNWPLGGSLLGDTSAVVTHVQKVWEDWMEKPVFEEAWKGLAEISSDASSPAHLTEAVEERLQKALDLFNELGAILVLGGNHRFTTLHRCGGAP